MRIVTLTTDLGYRDPYLAIVKSRLISSGNNLEVIDLSCGIKDGNVSDAAYVLRTALPHFPAGTMHIVSVRFASGNTEKIRSEAPDNSRFLLTEYKGQFILTSDVGLFTLIDPAFNSQVYQLYYQGNQSDHFHMKEVLAETCIKISNNVPVEEFGSPVNDYYRSFPFESFVTGNLLKGKGIYVDDFGNIVTNITRETFGQVVGTRPFTVTLPGARLNRISGTYDEVKFGSPLVLFNPFGHLEVAVNGKSAYNMLCPRDIGKSFDFNLMIEFQ